ncbi:hypothetical protein DH2020_045319 [Rehmannia glutinosa]|uniref:Glycine-rich protein n=1 Tax=Rehmannia glutinosa TaxID=99300 RepID=A0ABR0UFL3_REHGL
MHGQPLSSLNASLPVSTKLAHLATVLLISSQVAARDLAETSDTLDTSNEVDQYYGGGRGGYGGGGRGGYGGGGRGGYGGGRGGYGGGRGGYGGGGCRHGCCGRGFNGGCRCCSYAGEKVDAEPQN